jgi:hypothetical protein
MVELLTYSYCDDGAGGCAQIFDISCAIVREYIGGGCGTNGGGCVGVRMPTSVSYNTIGCAYEEGPVGFDP